MEAPSRIDYQLALTTPGINPWLAISLKQRRDNLNFLKNPLDLPVSWQRFLRRIGEEFFGILFKASTAFRRSSMGLVISRMTCFSSWRFSHLFLTSLSLFFCLAIEDFFAMLFPSSRPFLALLAIWIFLINHINAAPATDDFITFGRIRFDGSSDFHV